jgi:uncharacterized membrane protein (UPF0127 family)
MIAARYSWVLGLLWACNGAPAKLGSDAREPAPAQQVAQNVDARGSAREQNQAATNVPRGEPQPKLPMGAVEFELGAPRAPLRIAVEVAAKDRERQAGLMFRKQLADDEGMLFLFPTERYNSFWMHNTLIPLDMFFIDSEWTVVGVVENATPLTDDARQVGRMSQYVLEENAGFAARHKLGAGSKLKFSPPPGLELP